MIDKTPTPDIGPIGQASREQTIREFQSIQLRQLRELQRSLDQVTTNLAIFNETYLGIQQQPVSKP